MGALTNRIRRLERKAGVGDQMKIFITLNGEAVGDACPEMDSERLRERFGFKGYRPDVPVSVSYIETGPDGKERLIFKPSLVQSE